MLRALIVDDEPLARRHLMRSLHYADLADRVMIFGEASDGVEAVESLNSGIVDLVFLDVQMPGLDGFEVLERQTSSQYLVIFVSAYGEYMERASKCAQYVDFLLKPFSHERLGEAISKAEKSFNLARDFEVYDVLPFKVESPPFTLHIDPGTASPEDVGDLLAEISKLYRMIGGSGINFTPTKIRQVETA